MTQLSRLELSTLVTSYLCFDQLWVSEPLFNAKRSFPNEDRESLPDQFSGSVYWRCPSFGCLLPLGL